LSAFSPPEGLNIPTQSSIEHSQEEGVAGGVDGPSLLSEGQNLTFSNH
jgi:hypothetical protein